MSSSFLPYGYGLAQLKDVTGSEGSWLEEGQLLGFFPPHRGDPSSFLHSIVMSSSREVIRIQMEEVVAPLASNVHQDGDELNKSGIVLIIVWIDAFMLDKIFSQKQKDLLSLTCAWMSDDWNLLKEHSPSLLSALCVPVGAKKDDMQSSKLKHSFNDILNCAAKPSLLRPWDRLRNKNSETNGEIGDIDLPPVNLAIFNNPPLPTDMLREICQYLDAKSLFDLSLCNSFLRDCTLTAVPGLKLRLHPHQFTTVWWMLQQEIHYSKSIRNYEGREKDILQPKRTFQRVLSPCARDCLTTLENALRRPLFITQWLPLGYCSIQENSNYSSIVYDIQRKVVLQLERCGGSLGDHSNFGHLPVRGGMLCDEPGLGKTISILAVVLKTLGTVASTRHMPGESSSEVRGPALRTKASVSRRRSVDADTLLTSGATLIVVPEVLMDHWKLQVNSFVNPRILRKVFFDDDALLSLPSHEILASYELVVTTFKRLSGEWKQGKPLCSLDVRKPKRFADYQAAQTKGIHAKDYASNVSPLLKIYWLRVVVDEGHALGKSTVTNVIRMACTIESDRRWVLTGTPTPSYTDAVTSPLLRHIGNILKFLRHNPFGGENGEMLWKQFVSRPLENSKNSQPDLPQFHSPRKLLVKVLSQVMIRHSKESIEDIPKPIWKETKLEMNDQERAAYNAVVALAQSNLVVTGKDYTLPGSKHPDSLLNTINRKFLSQTLSNIRVASCGGGHIKLKLVPYDDRKSACLQLLRECNTEPALLQQMEDKVSAFIFDVTEGILHACELCSVNLPLLLIAPCGHLYCPECMNEMGDFCRLCERYFSWDTFQKLQPGFEASDYVFNESSVIVVDPVLQQSPPLNAIVLAAELPSLTPSPHTAGLTSRHESVDSAIAQAKYSTKAMYLVSKICELKTQHAANMELYSTSQSSLLLKKTILPKIIVFSQFTEFLDRLSVDFTEMHIKFAYFRGMDKAGAIKKFKNISDISVLFLTKEGSHGLDLSFVTHIFLLDSILDDSILSQVISRAYRMGSQQRVVVDQVMMTNTIEETIHGAKRQDVKILQSIMNEKLCQYTHSSRTLTNTRSHGDKRDVPSSSVVISQSCSQSSGANEENSTTSFPLMHFLITSLALLRNQN